MEESTSARGACLCGEVCFEVTLPVSICVHCHCTMCQRGIGAGFVTWFAVPNERLSFVSGKQNLVRYTSSDHGTRSFCGTCGSSMFCESKLHPDEVDIVLANMTDPIGADPQLHIYFDDRAEWIDVRDELPRLGGETGVEPLDQSPSTDTPSPPAPSAPDA